MSNTLSNTKQWFEKAVPQPTATNVRVQLGVHVEEVYELLCEIFTNSTTTSAYVNDARTSLYNLSQHLKSSDTGIAFPNRVATLDAICDQLVTGTGLAHMLNMDPVVALAEVNHSNWSKFDDGEPLFDENGKIIKGDDYHPPDLEPFV